MAKDQSKQRLLEAGRSLLASGTVLGVNAVAAKAGLNKVLIYRYFQDWDGYLEVISEGLNLWRAIRLELVEGLASDRWTDPASASAWVLNAYQQSLRNEPGILTIMANEQARSSPLLVRLDQERETEGLLILHALREKWPLLPWNRVLGLSALLSAGLSHLILRSRQTNFFNGLDLAKDETWNGLIQDIEELVRTALSPG